MKPKFAFKCVALVLCVCTLLALASCHRQKIQDEIEAGNDEKDSGVLNPETGGSASNSYVPSEDGPTDTGYQLWTIHKDGDVGYYEQKSAEDLSDAYLWREENHQMVNLPTGIFFSADNDTEKNVFYNKLTGNVSAWCPDPLCVPEECIWYNARIMYVSQQYIYFVSRILGDEGTLYRCDLQRNNITEIADKWNLNDSIWGETDDPDQIYVCKFIYRAGQSSYETVGTMDIGTGQYDVRLEDEEKHISIRAIIGNDIWYNVYNASNYENKVYHTDKSFKNPELFCDNGYVSVLSDQYLLVNVQEDMKNVDQYLYHIKTGEKTHLPLDMFVSNISGDYIYYQKPYTQEEQEAFPLKEYFTYAPIVKVERKKGDRVFIEEVKIDNWTASAGRICRYNILTGEEELVMELTYDGLPIEMYLECVDGEVCYFAYYTYKDFYNYYNREHSTGNTKLPVRYAKADFSNGTVTFIDPYSLFE